MIIRRDKLGRRIPEFDRKASAKKADITRRANNGDDFYSRIGSLGGRERTRGNFGKLKAEGKTDELKDLGTQGAIKSNEVQGKGHGAKSTDEGQITE